MQLQKKHKPAGACNVCHALTDKHELLNSRCMKTVNNRRCSGIYKSGLTDIWDECESCKAAGLVGTQVCIECSGFGWHLYG